MNSLKTSFSYPHSSTPKSGNQKTAWAESNKKPVIRTENTFTDKLEIAKPKENPISFSFPIYTQARPDAPKFPAETSGKESELSYTIQTIVYGENPKDHFAIKMAEITIDNFEVIATVKLDNGHIIVDFEEDFEPSDFNIPQKKFDLLVKEAVKELGAVTVQDSNFHSATLALKD